MRKGAWEAKAHLELATRRPGPSTNSRLDCHHCLAPKQHGVVTYTQLRSFLWCSRTPFSLARVFRVVYCLTALALLDVDSLGLQQINLLLSD